LDLSFRKLNSYIILLLVATINALGIEVVSGQSYQIVCDAVHTDGSIDLEITNPKDDNSYQAETARKDAVHAIIYKGVTSNGKCGDVVPLLDTQEKIKKFKEIEKTFFRKKGDWNRFANIDVGSINGTSSKDKTKSYKITVAKENLRKYLIENKIIDSLVKGF
jgi:hypothetical protein